MVAALQVFWWNVARTVRRHRLLALCNVLSIALGIAVYLAIRIANESANRAFSGSIDLVAGKAHLEIRGDVDETLWPVVARQPGVAAATGLVEALVTLPDFPGEYLRIAGVDVFSGAQFQTYQMGGAGTKLDAERWLAEPGGIAITEELAKRNGMQIGRTIKAVADGRTVTLTVRAIISNGDLPIADSRFAAMDIGWAQELLQRPGKLTALQIQLHDPTQADVIAAALQKVTPGLAVRAPAQRSAQVGKMLGAFQLNLTALSMVSLLVGVFLIYNTVSTSVARRRVQIGITRALGLPAWRVRVHFLGESLLYAIPGVLLGAAGGVALSRTLSTAVGHTVTSLYTLVNVERLWLEPRQFAVAACYGVIAALAGAWWPASEAARVAPVDALRRGVDKSRGEISVRGWWPWGFVTLALAAVVGWRALVSGPAWLAFASAFLVLSASACFAPWVVTAFARSGRGTAWVLAARRLRRGLLRNAITVSALSAAVAMFVALVTMVYSFRSSLDSWIGKGIVADLYFAPAANEMLGLHAYLPPHAIAWLKAHPAVASVDTIRESTVTMQNEPVLLAVVDGQNRNNLNFIEGDGKAALDRMFAGDAVVITEPMAHRFQLHAGDKLPLETPRGRVDIEIAGVYGDYSRDQGVIIAGKQWYARYWSDVRMMSATVYLQPGSDGTALEEEFRKTFATEGQFAIHTSRAMRQRILGIFDQTFAVTEVLRTVAIFVAIAGVFLTMTTLVTERRREMALMRALGASPELVSGAVLTEAALLGLASATLGLIAGIPLAMVLTWVVNPAFFGWTIPFRIPWMALAGIPVWVTLAAVVAAWWPARIARRVEIAEALHEE